MKYYLFYTLFLLSLFSTLQAVDPPLNDQTLLDQILNFAKGHQEFKDLYFKQHEAEFVRLVEQGQNPQILFISCSDSRVVPDLILNTRPGDLFVIRNAGNFVPPINFPAAGGVAATIQYAVEVLNVRHIIVCGHSHCGAIQGLFQDLDSQRFDILKKWLTLGEEAKQMALLATKLTNHLKEDIYSVTEKISVIYQLEHLMSYPFVKKRVLDGKLELHGWYFKIETGQLWYYNGEQYRFLPLIKKFELS